MTQFDTLTFEFGIVTLISDIVFEYKCHEEFTLFLNLEQSKAA